MKVSEVKEKALAALIKRIERGNANLPLSADLKEKLA